MQCTSFVPVYYQPRGVNSASGFSWHLSSSNNVNYGAPRSFESSVQSSTMNPYLSYDKNVLRQIIQNHEAIFRHQVQELHRVYERQKELMDEMRTRGVATQWLLSQTSESMRCLSQPRSDITQTSHTPSWLLGDHLNGKLPDSKVENVHQSPNFVLGHCPFGGKTSCPEVEYLSSRSKTRGKRNLDLELPADLHCDIDAKKFKDRKSSESPDVMDNAAKKVSCVQPGSDSEIGSVKMENLLNLNIGKSCLIDLNEPAQLESLSSNSTGAFGAYTIRMELMRQDRCDASSDGTDSSLVIDLNSVPVSCFSEMESAAENLLTIKKETAVLSDGSSGHDSRTKGLCAEDSTLLNGSLAGSLAKTQTNIGLEMNVADENCSLPPSVSARNADFKHPASPENEDPTVSEKGEEKPNAELDIIAAWALIMISSFESRELTKSENTRLLGNPGHWLNWFAEIVCFTGDDLEDKIAELQNGASNNDQGGIVASLGCDSEAAPVKENGVGKKKGNGCTSSIESTKASAREERQHQKRNASKKASSKPRNCSKIVSILKEQSGRDGVLQGWGKMRKRQGGHRCRTGKFLFAY